MDDLEFDALLVLGGEDRQLWPRCSAALHHYLDCCERGRKPPQLIVSGGKVVRHDNQWFSESALMVRFFLANGVPPGELLVEPHATDTFGNVVLGSALAHLHQLTRVAMVTDDFHHWRSRKIFMQVSGVAPVRILPTGIKGTWRARIRERLAFWALRMALQVAGVPRGNLGAHKLFWSRKYLEAGHAGLFSEFNRAALPEPERQSGNCTASRLPDVAAQGMNP